MSSYLTRSSLPQRTFLRPAPPKRISIPASDRLNTIFERDPNADPSQDSKGGAPHGLGRLRNARHSHLSNPPLESDEKPPPDYDPNWATPETGQGRAGRRPTDGRDGRLTRWRTSVGRRGGLWRLALLILLVLLVILGLALGLGLGLTLGRRRHSSASGLTTNNTSRAFPVGSWTFDVVLADVVTDCTANAATWACFPYTTYAQSTAASRFTFNWVINSTSSNTVTGLTIGSTPNLFSLNFNPTALHLTDAGMPSERYTFSLPLAKQVQPTQALSDDNARSICYFNQTTVAGSLYTHGNHTPASNLTIPQTWAGTVYLEQRSPSGAGTPDCYRATDGSRLTQGLEAQAIGRDCVCGYESANKTTVASR